MKIKAVYIYIGGFILFILALTFFTGNENKTSENPHQNMGQMPDDDVHKGMEVPGNEAPSKSNVKKDALAKMEELKNEVEANPNDTANVRKYADMLAMGHQPDKAIELYENILKKDSKRIDIMLQLTYLYFTKGNYNMAENYTNKILSIDKNNQYANYNVGAVAVAKGDKEKAKKVWTDVSKKFPGTEVGNMAQQSIQQLEQSGKKN